MKIGNRNTIDFDEFYTNFLINLGYTAYEIDEMEIPLHIDLDARKAFKLQLQ